MPRITASLILLLLCVCLWGPALSYAQCPGVTTQLRPFATEELTIGATATPLTASIYRPAGVTPVLALLSIQGGPIRYLDVGTPTATTGHPLSNATITICGLDSIAAFKAIRQTTDDALIVVTYYRTKTP
jgi:hypothetical protein